MESVRRSLRRQGALSWHLAEDVSDPEAMLESFTVATWSEYHRMPERATVADEEVERELREAVGGELPWMVAYRVIDVHHARSPNGPPTMTNN